MVKADQIDFKNKTALDRGHNMSSSSQVPEDISDDDLRADFAALLPDYPLPPITPHTRALLLEKIRKVKKERKGAETKKGCQSNPEDQPRPIVKAIHKTPRPTPEPIVNAHDLNEVSNYVFLDVESTGLASANPRTRITELAMVAVSKEEFGTLRRDLRLSKYKSDPEALTPRVLNKLTLCFSPQTPIPPQVSQMTGLDNCLLEDQGHFDSDAVQQIKYFLRRLLKPICLVAHNGRVFDFPLLVAEVMRCGGEIEYDGLVCMDSLVTLKAIDERELRVVDEEIAGVEAISALSALDDDDFGEEAGISEMAWDQGEEFNTAPSSPAGNGDSPHFQLPNTPPKSDPFEHGVMSPPVVHSFQSPDSSQVLHLDGASASATAPGSEGGEEVTPERPILATDVPPPLSPKANKRAKLKRQRQQEPHPKSARKRLNFGPRPRQPYSLPRLHEHMLGHAPTISHGAEADCLALMRVCATRQVRATANSPDCFKISSIKPMW